MKLAIDVHFDGEGARAAAVAFDAWDAPEATRTYSSRVPHIEKARTGELDLRKLPCIIQLLREHALEPELVMIDGFVDLDAKETPGLGRHLYHALGGRAAVVGVSKSSNPALPPQFEVMREEESRPLLVTSVGIDIGAAKAGLRAMHGRKRVPTLLKLVARVAKGTVA
jgi:deoxyribonuclease V